MTHSPEPWVAEGAGDICDDRGSIGTGIKSGNITVAVALHLSEYVDCNGVKSMAGWCCGPDSPAVGGANAERIVACVNACRGIPTDRLWDGCVHELMESDGLKVGPEVKS